MAVTNPTAEPRPGRGQRLNAPEGVTTRDDALDLGVPMAEGETRPSGPEDALGVGEKRGDYSDRIGPSSYRPHEVVVTDDDEAFDDPNQPSFVAEPQRPRVDDRATGQARAAQVHERNAARKAAKADKGQE